MNITAKFVVASRTENADGSGEVRLVIPTNGSPTEASGTVQMRITNPEAFAAFKLGAPYVVVFASEPPKESAKPTTAKRTPRPRKVAPRAKRKVKAKARRR